MIWFCWKWEWEGIWTQTNIISCTLVAVLASISMDHQEFLGNTLQEIAEKKSGHYKTRMHSGFRLPGRKSAGNHPKSSEKSGSKVERGKSREADCRKKQISGARDFLYEGEEYEISLSGEHQPGNAAVALKTLQCLDEKGFPTTLEQRKTGLKEAQWPGRFSVIHRSPLFIVDGAHNPGAAEMLAESVRRYFNGKKIFYIIGMFKDKDYNKVLEITCPYAQKIWTIQTPDNPRALPAGKLARAAARFHPCVEEAGSMEEAVKKSFFIQQEKRM